jgi:DNA polymerase-3 subunit epsilon
MLAQLLNLTRPLFLFDLETTSADTETARICQIGYQLHKPGGEVVEWHSLIDPLVEIPKESTAAHGITDEIIRTGCAKCRVPLDIHPSTHEFKPIPRFKDVGYRLHAGIQGCDFAGYNVLNFDIPVLTKQLERECNLVLDMEGVSIIDGHRIWQLLEPRSLTHAVAHFGDAETLTDAHDAMNDVRGTAIALIGQLTRHKNSTLLPRSVSELFQHCYPDRIDYEGKFVFNKLGEACLGFGKHKGQPMMLCMDYIKWMKKQNNWSRPVMKIIDEALAGRFPQRKPV